MRCGWADNILVVETDGYTRPCCAEPGPSARIVPITDGIKSAWQSPVLKNLRLNLEQGYSDKTDPWCKRCRLLEDVNEPSLRKKPLDTVGHLKGIQFKLSNICQLACAHCHWTLSSQHHKYEFGGNGIIRAIDNIEIIIKDLKDLLPQLEFIKFTGGEPWHDKQHWQILEGLKDVNRSNCRLEYITNGLSKPKEYLWEGWKDVKITISVDGVEETYEWFRQNAKWSKFLKAFNYYENNYNVVANYSITPWTIEDWEDAELLFQNINANPVIFPDHASVKSLPKNLLALPFNTPFLNLLNGDDNSLRILRDWAINWDTRWSNEGKSKDLFPWLF